MNRLTKTYLILLSIVLAVSLVWTIVLAVTSQERAKQFADGAYDLAQSFYETPQPDQPPPSQRMANRSTLAMGHLFAISAVAGGLILLLLWKDGLLSQWVRWGCAASLALILYGEHWAASSHFLEYYNLERLYSDHAVFKKLRTDPERGRVTLLTRGGFYNMWLSLLFPYWGIDSIDIPAASRPPADYTAFFGAVDRVPLRKWELCSVRYVLAPVSLATNTFATLNAQAQFRPVVQFELGSVQNALFEYSRSLPRALVLHRWEVVTDSEQTLERLTNPKFDPHTTVLLEKAPTVSSAADAPNLTPVRIVKFEHSSVTLKTTLKSPGILMLNDRFDSDWTATVNGQPAPILRANFIMRGLELQAGQHDVVFRFNVPRLMVAAAWAKWGGIVALGVVTAITLRSGRRKRT